ncbi:MAG: sulfate transporter, ATPase subunit [Oscillospiraceae bacterium]|jgi:sulfate transport system ATP-binding protein|nr:sulfate transporter, ATPase subunit [Oscillospiraceae bacterium]
MYVELKNVNKHFKDFKATDNVSFSIEQGELIGLLGPSGSGKTTILRMIAGLETPDSGDIIINGVIVNDIPPGKRGIGFVFQNYALFRHMTVFDNIAFGLQVLKTDKKLIKERVLELIELIGLKGLEKRYPHQLSGGQRQRVAFARALSPNPQLLLLDEPFAAIDAKVRKELRSWLREMMSTLGITSIFVTHDQEEAVEVADKIIITNNGKIEQKGSPIEIYKNPQTPFVAQFVGQSTVLEDYTALKGFSDYDKNVKAVLRPEFVQIYKTKSEEIQFLSAAQKGTVKNVFFRGNTLEIEVQVGDLIIIGNRSLEQEQVFEKEEVYVLINRLYLISDSSAYMVENKLKIDPLPISI